MKIKVRVFQVARWHSIVLLRVYHQLQILNLCYMQHVII